MKIPEIKKYLDAHYTKIEPFPALFILNNYDDFDTTKQICNATITDMYAVKALAYITLEKEAPTLSRPNILKVFSYTRGLDVLSSGIMDDLIEAKYGQRYRFFGDKDDFNTTLSFQSSGVWTTGVQFCQYELDHNLVDESIISGAVEFSENFAIIVSSVTITDLLSLSKKTKKISIDKLLDIFKNLQSRHFEVSVQEFLRSKYNYSDIRTRYKPPYLGKEIDVYGKKGRTGETKTIVICECKLKFSNRQVQVEEITRFADLTAEVQQHEKETAKKEGGSVKVKSYLVTNSYVSSATKDFLNRRGIQIMLVQLPSNWHERGDWEIVGFQ
ncbi:MAG: hypothetical protein NWF00_00485 [Candidatus Bathyarchaeota archaeon]|nr:hypothetical protein [Candidatus Bathyarchaeota archaeon]